MIILITGMFDTYNKNGIKKSKGFMTSHGYETKTGKNVVVS